MAAREAIAGPFADAFRSACGNDSPYECWQRFVYGTSSEIAQAFGQDISRISGIADASREKAAERIGSYHGMLSAWLDAIEENPFQDFLGDAFMRLGIGNEAGGQFFTPYHIARTVAEAAIGGFRDLPDKGWVSIYEPSCGAGACAIAALDVLGSRGVDWQRGAFLVCQDVSESTALMCYMQLSMIGAAATVIVGDTLAGERAVALHTPVAVTDPAWVLRMVRGELSDVW